MPVISQSPQTYVATSDELIAHWTRANVTAAGTPIKLKGNYFLADFTIDRNNLSEKIAQVRAVLLSRQMSAGLRDQQKTTIREYLIRFRGAVTNALMDTPYANNLPTLPVFATDETRYKEPFLAMAERWRAINALGGSVADFTAPLTIGDGIRLEDYELALADLESSYRAVGSADAALDTLRSERNALLEPLKKRMQQYKAALIDRFGKDHALVKSLPALSPTPGATPPPVALSGSFDAARGKAVLSWGASAAADLDHYEVRTTGELPYRAEDEAVVASVPATQLSLETDEGLIVSNATANFKVYVVTRTNHERGSNAVKIKRT